MNIYLLKQEVNNEKDTYDSCVVVAESEDAAKRIHPSPAWKNGGFYNEYKKAFCMNNTYGETYDYESKYGDWTNDLDAIKVTLIGQSNILERGVVLASFNAG
jgi:hypothetical protein